MLRFLKSLSRTVHQFPEELEEGMKGHNHKSNYDTEDCTISLTVWRKSLVFNCNGFTVIGSDGNLVYRVDNYRGCSDQIVLMDGTGNPIFTICRRRKLRLVDCNSWLVYDGEVGKSRNNSSSKPIFYVRKNMNILETDSKVLAYVYDGIYDKKRVYTIEGTYKYRMCKILEESRRVVAEIKRKQDVAGGVSFGLEVFVLSVRPGLDSGVAMAIVSLLDQMFS
ncbi:protein LURP-one-related 17 isoform X1 [Primulina eburnea]|uniref:protein LURP-one-related 17 isoform X1 n=1 Tax=Primulina eburnea TaxID=1245227 RepID=UPI003C6C496A